MKTGAVNIERPRGDIIGAGIKGNENVIGKEIVDKRQIENILSLTIHL